MLFWEKKLPLTIGSFIQLAVSGLKRDQNFLMALKNIKSTRRTNLIHVKNVYLLSHHGEMGC